MTSFRKTAYFTVVSLIFVYSVAWGEPQKKSYGQLEPDISQEIICPDGIKRLVAVAVEPIVKGIPPVKAISIAKRVAILKAKATLADFIKGSEFDQTTTATDIVKIQGGIGVLTEENKFEYIGRMRTAALRGIEVVDLDRSGKDFVRVTVGVSDESIQTAIIYDSKTNNSFPSVPDSNTSRRTR